MTDVLERLDAAGRERAAALRAGGRFFWADLSLSETPRAQVVDALDLPAGAARALDTEPGPSTSRPLHADGESVVFAVRCYVRGGPLEVRVVVSPAFLLTLHDERVALPAALAVDLPEEPTQRDVLYAVLDAMLDSAFDALEDIEVTLDALAAAGTEGGNVGVTRAQLRHDAVRLAMMRRWMTAEQALLDRLDPEVAALRGFESNGDRSLTRLGPQVGALLASVDAAANAMGTLLDLQLNRRAYVVSVVATIFVPLTVITGFFGMNFGWMVERLRSPVAFWLLGVAFPVLAALVAWRLLLRRSFPRRR